MHRQVKLQTNPVPTKTKKDEIRSAVIKGIIKANKACNIPNIYSSRLFYVFTVTASLMYEKIQNQRWLLAFKKINQDKVKTM